VSEGEKATLSFTFTQTWYRTPWRGTLLVNIMFEISPVDTSPTSHILRRVDTVGLLTFLALSLVSAVRGTSNVSSDPLTRPFNSCRTSTQRCQYGYARAPGNKERTKSRPGGLEQYRHCLRRLRAFDEAAIQRSAQTPRLRQILPVRAHRMTLYGWFHESLEA
jgi:hypothetical protein